jgi:hypothetical protein
MTLAETAKLRLSIGVEPSDQGKLKVGQPVKLESVPPERASVETPR